MKLIRDTSAIMLIIWTMLLSTAVISLGLSRWSLAFVSFATLALSLLPPLLAARWSLRLPLPFLLFTTLFFFASIFLGEAFDFYERLWWWDIALHGLSAVGFGLTGFLFVFMLFEGDRFAAPPSAIAFISFCVAMTVGAIWEVFEFAMDLSFGLNMQKSGLDDTMGDLIVDALGGLIASITGYFYLRRNSAGLLGRGLGQFIEMNQRLYRKYKQRVKK
ncbi:hypothetical protein [Roseobacter sp.]|uniref:hypothetical protein n=1 Tax=Roseobacter sp. TaxID=1907202 RepID=UPI00385D3724